MTPWAAIGSTIAFARELYRDWKNGRPQRERTQLDADYDRDIATTQQAAATRDPATLTRNFEAERLSAVRRGDRDPSPPGELP